MQMMKCKKTISGIISFLFIAILFVCNAPNARAETISLRVGEKVFFGSYNLDDFDGSASGIEWIVAARDDTRYLLVSRVGLESMPYHSEDTAVTWENSSLRGWLNGSFYDGAFDANEKNAIVSTVLPADMNPKYPTETGNSTEDKVFILSYSEAIQYLQRIDYDLMNASISLHVKNLGTDMDGVCCYWWLRTPGDGADSAMIVDPSGTCDMMGSCVAEKNVVRPAVWIDSEKVTFSLVSGTGYIPDEEHPRYKNAIPKDYLEDLMLQGYYRVYKEEEYEEFTKEQLDLLRNGQYAMDGKIFTNPIYKTYFESRIWYEPVAEKVKTTKNASKNSVQIRDFEREKGMHSS